MKKIMIIAILIVALMVTGCGAGPGGLKDATSDMPSGETATEAPTAEAPMEMMPPEYSYDGEKYLDIVEGGFIDTEDENKATISLKVDTAAFTNVQRYINDSQMPPEDAVRTEELINYFSFDEDVKKVDDSPFGVYNEIGPSPFDANKKMAFIRIKTDDIDKEELPPSNLVFLIDTSGSMDSYDKLPLLQDSFSMLVDNLDENDRVSIVTYAGSSDVVAKGVPGDNKNKLNRAIYDLWAGGSTAGAKGIQTAYEIAKENFIENGNNRVILASDGDFNVGMSDLDELSEFISDKRDTGIYLSILGFGTGNIRDDIMETLAKDGSGNYSYIDTKQAAKKVLVEEMGGNMFTVADDVKAQVEFNSETVKDYRLIGYENRVMANEDFSDDRKDAGEIGAGSDVIVLFEMDVINPTGKLYDVNIRYKDPGESESKLISIPANAEDEIDTNTSDYNFACTVAVFGDMLRHPENINDEYIEKLIKKTEDNLGSDTQGYRSEYVKLLYKFDSMSSSYQRDYWED